MNYSAEICSALADEGGRMHVDALEDRVGLSTKTCDALLGKLCGEGVLKRDRDYIVIKNDARARMLAEQASPKHADREPPPALAAAMSAPRPAPAARKPRNPRVEIPVPATLEIQRGVPIAPKRFGYGAKPLPPWPFAKMEIGDSFAVPVPEGMAPKDVAAALRRDADAFTRILPDLRVAVRIEEGMKTVRLWREPPKDSAGAKSAATSTADRLDVALARKPASGIRTRRKGGGG